MTVRFALEPSSTDEILYSQAGRPTLDLQFASKKSLTDQISGLPLIDFTRSGNATYFDADGVMQTAGTNTARFDHDPETGESLGLLIEEQRTNLLTYSEEIEDASWSKAASSITANATTAPNGATLADKVVEDLTNSSHGVFRYPAVISNATVTGSVFLKKAERQYIRLTIGDAYGANSATARINLDAGTVDTATTGTNPPTSVSASLVPCPNGWYRAIITATLTGSSTNGLFGFNSVAPGWFGYTGDGASGFFAWGAQLEAGAFPTSYIPTTSTTVTRNADVAQITGSNFSRWYSQSQGTMFADGVSRGGAVGGLYEVSAFGSSAQSVSVRLGQMFSFAQGLNRASFSYTLNTEVKHAFGVQAGNYAAYYNGSALLIVNGQPADTPANGNQITLGSLNGLFLLNGTIRRLAYFDRRLPNATLQSITSDTPPTTYGNLVLNSANTPQAIAGVAPTLDYRFARDKREIEAVSLTDKLTYTGGNGTFVGSDGYIQRATTNVPRFDHDPLSRVSKGLLVEGSRQNLLLRSEEFDNASWTKTRVQPFGSGSIANAIAAPDGTLTADKLVEDTTASNNHFIGQSYTSSSGTYTFSCYVKAAERTQVFIGMTDGVSALIGGTFTLTTGTASISPGGSWTNVSVSILPLSDGWYRCIATATQGAGTAITARIYLSSSGNTTYTGDGTSGIYLWGAQLEAGSTPSTYIPTTTAAVTRTADSAVIDGTGVLTGTYTMVAKPEGCAQVSGTDIVLQPGYTAERVMVFPATLTAQQITDIREAM